MKYLYIATALLTVASYWFVRPYIILQEPPQAYITVSNLTLNYVLFYMFIGGTTHWIASKKLFKSISPIKRGALSVVVTIVVAGLVLIVLSPWYQLKI